MHELAMSEGIVATARQAAAGKGRMTAITVEVGALSGTYEENLRFCMEAVLAEHGMKDMQINILPVRAKVKCACGEEYEPKDLFSACPHCGGYRREIVEGMDVVITSIEVESDDESGDEQAGAGEE